MVQLGSLDLFVLGFATAVICGAFSVICFFYFVTWLGHLLIPQFREKCRATRLPAYSTVRKVYPQHFGNYLGLNGRECGNLTTDRQGRLPVCERDTEWGYCLLVNSTSSLSISAACPLSIAWAHRSAPRSRLSQIPDTQSAADALATTTSRAGPS